MQKAFQAGRGWLDRMQQVAETSLEDADAFGGRADGAPTTPAHEITDFGDNPGHLRMFMRVPPASIGVATSIRAHAGAVQGTSRLPGEPARSPALVVVLHGCLQTPASYDRGSGWSILADRCGFALLLAGQRAANNPNRCFNWFSPDHAARDAGEACSIRQMIDYMIRHHGVDRRRIFVVGLSAGGAMATNLLAVYPEVFAAGAVLSGLAFGSAASMSEALTSMAQGCSQTPKEWGNLVRAASAHSGPWPRLSVWHGGADTVVHPANAEALVAQWTDLHRLGRPPREEVMAGHRRRVWSGADGRAVIESFTIAGMGHGVPVTARGQPPGVGSASPFHLEAGICSTSQIARFWGLLPPAETVGTAVGVSA